MPLDGDNRCAALYLMRGTLAEGEKRLVGPTLTDDKSIWRSWARQRRDALDPVRRHQGSERLLERLRHHPRFLHARTLLIYGSIASEVDTWPLLSEILERGDRLLMPRVAPDRRSLELYQMGDLKRDLLPPGLWGLREPDERCCPLVPVSEVDFILVPGLLFDAQGYRLGYGGGFYDRLLAGIKVGAYRLALAFHEQRVERLPHEIHDQPIDECLYDEESSGDLP